MIETDQLFFVFIFLILVVYLISMINRFSAPDLPDDIRYIDAHEMNTGDIVCVSYNNLAGVFVGSFTHSVWVHTGMIWVDPKTNVRYVMEGAIYGQKAYQHFYKIPITTWMYINRHNVMGYKKYYGPEIDAVKMEEYFEPFIKNSKLEGLNVFWLRFFLNQEYREHEHKNKYTCFESTVILGQMVGIISKKKHYSSYFPKDLVNNTMDYNEGISYSKTVQICGNNCEKNLLFSDMCVFPDFWQK